MEHIMVEGRPNLAPSITSSLSSMKWA